MLIFLIIVVNIDFITNSIRILSQVNTNAGATLHAEAIIHCLEKAMHSTKTII